MNTTNITSCANTDFAPYLNKENSETNAYIQNGPIVLNSNKVAIAAVCLIGLSTLTPTLTDASTAPSYIKPYSHVFGFKAETNNDLPSGFKIINKSDVASYIHKYKHLKFFLESNLNKLKELSERTEFALEYEGISEEEWENLYVIIYLDNDNDDYVTALEEKLINEWFPNNNDDISSHITISFDWK